MAVKKYDKLIRDKIPQIIQSSGATCTTYVAGDEEYKQRLSDKLLEEAKEFFEDPCAEELADVYEVILALAEANRWDIERERIAKRLERGAFSQRYILQEVKRND